MKFIEVTLEESGDKVLLNLDMVSEVNSDPSGGCGLFNQHGEGIVVKESYAEIKKMLIP